MVVHGMQGGSGWGGHPGGIGPCLWVVDLGAHHGRHFIWHCPHALADLCMPRQAAGQTHINVPVFVRLNPGLVLDLRFTDHRPCFR